MRPHARDTHTADEMQIDNERLDANICSQYAVDLVRELGPTAQNIVADRAQDEDDSDKSFKKFRQSREIQHNTDDEGGTRI